MLGGAEIPNRTRSLPPLTTVITMLPPMTIRSPCFRLKTSIFPPVDKRDLSATQLSQFISSMSAWLNGCVGWRSTTSDFDLVHDLRIARILLRHRLGELLQVEGGNTSAQNDLSVHEIAAEASQWEIGARPKQLEKFARSLCTFRCWRRGCVGNCLNHCESLRGK